MKLLPVTMFGDKILRKKVDNLDEVNNETVELITNMFDTMHNASGIGLAANQVGANKSIFIVDLSKVEEYEDSKPIVFINPKIIKFKTKLESDISWVVLANSITLTPGTIAMDIKDGEFFVHSLSKKVSDDLNTGIMEDRVAHIFMEADHIYVQDVLDVAPIFGELRKGL